MPHFPAYHVPASRAGGSSGCRALPALLSDDIKGPFKRLVVGVNPSQKHNLVLDELLDDLSLPYSSGLATIHVSLLVLAPLGFSGITGPHKSMLPQKTHFQVTSNVDRFPDDVGLILGQDFLTPNLWRQRPLRVALVLEHRSNTPCQTYP
jgi:hypothetical protein